MDLSVLFQGHVASKSVVEISFTYFVLAALKAMLRSVFLKTSVNSLPLFERVMNMDETVYIGEG